MESRRLSPPGYLVELGSSPSYAYLPLANPQFTPRPDA